MRMRTVCYGGTLLLGAAAVAAHAQQVGACCYQEGDAVLCALTTHSDCVELVGGTWVGAGTDCRDGDGNGVADACESEREGACCYTEPTGNLLCTVTTQALCEEQFGGAWQGPGSDCADHNGNGLADVCERGACCFTIGSAPPLCEILTEDDCIALFQGDWKGPGTDCADTDGSGVADICDRPPAGCRGDYDCDGDIDFFDIDFLLAALGGEPAWVGKHMDVFGVPPSCDYLENCDVNGDSTVDFFDIDGFLDVLGTACP